MTPDVEKETRETIEAYLKGIKTGDLECFERAFYSDSVVINASEEDPSKAVIPISDFAASVKARHDSGTPVEEIPLGITMSQVANVANVRLDFKLRIGETKLFGTDYFNMVRREGVWRISQKIYDVTHTA
jgi:hypothetical protein